MKLNATGGLEGWIYNGSTWVGTTYSGSGNLHGTGWHHAAFSFNDVANTYTLYLDGNQVGSGSTASSISYSLGANSFVGKHGNGLTNTDFNGRIDDARVYSRALTGGEIAALATDLNLVDTDTVALNIAAVNDSPSDLLALPGVSATDIIGSYSFDAAGALGRDDAGNDAPMTLSGGPAQTSGPSGSGALSLTGGQYGDISGITTGGPMTLAGWMRFDSTGTWQRVLDLGQANSTGIGNIYVGREGATNNLTFTIETNSGVPVAYRATATGAITNGTWMHFAATVDASGDMNLYVNGTLAAHAEGIAPTVGVRTNNYIGKSNWPDAPFDGAIDELLIANGVMTADQITALYQQSSGFTVAENAANGTVVGTVLPVDQDGTSPYAFSLVNSAGGRFAIDANGQISVADGTQLDHETLNSHNITVRVMDSGGQFYDEVFAVALTNVNEAPVIAVPASQTTNEDTAKVFSIATSNPITVADVDAGGANNEVTLTVSNGTLTLAGTAGLTFVTGDGTADTTITVRGTASAITAALDGLTYMPTAEFSGSDTLTVTATDSAAVALAIDVDLQGRYTFDSSPNDVGPGTAQNGVLVGGPGYVTDGTRGQVLSLDGVNDYVQITGTFGNPSEVTIGGWVDLTSVTTRGEFISLSDRVHIALDETGLGVKGSVQTGVGTWTDLASGRFIAGTGWHHVMYTYSDTDNTHSLYIDGGKVATAAIAGSVYWTGATDTFIGRHPTSGYYPTANVDDVRIYNRALSASEVGALAGDMSSTISASVSLTVSAVDDPPAIAGLAGDSLSYTEGAGALIVEQGANTAVTDIDSANFDTGTLIVSFGTGAVSAEDLLGIRNQGNGAGQIGVSGSTLSFGGVNIGSFAGGSGGAPLVVTFNSNASAAAVDAALRNVTYQNVDTGAPTARTLTLHFALTDGDGATSPTYDTSVVISTVNDAPAFTGLDGAPTHTEGGSAVVLDANVQVADPELSAANDFGGATLTLSRNGGANVQDQLMFDGLVVTTSGANVFVGGVTVGTYTLTSGQLSVTFGTGATQAQVNTLLQNVLYANNSNAPPASVQIDWTLSDGNAGAQGSGGALAANGSTTVTITATNDAPVLGYAGAPGAVSFTEQSPVALAAFLTVSDPDDATLTGATLVISGNYENGADVLNFTNQLGIAGVWNAATGALTLSGVATTADYQTALRSIAFYNGSDTPSTAQRTVDITVTDGSAISSALTRTVNITGVNDAPTGLPVVTGSVTEDQTLTADTSAIADADGLGAFSFQWRRNGSLIGGANAQTYTLSDADVGANISVTVSYTDGQGTAETLTSGVVGAVSNVNDAPTGAPVITGSAIEDQTLTAATASIADFDGVGAFSYQWLRDGVSISGATGATYTLGDADVGTNVSVTVSYVDGYGTGESLTSTAVGPVANVNDAPTGSPVVVGVPTEDQTLTADTTAIGDADGLGPFGYQWLRNGVAITGANGGTYALGDADVGATITVQVSYTDGQGTTESLTSAGIGPIANVNDAPSIVSDGGGASASLNVVENLLAVTSVAATDVDVPADTLTYSIVGGSDQALFAIDSNTGALTFIAQPDAEAPADANADGVYDVVVQVDDGNGGVDTQAIAVSVGDVNEFAVGALSDVDIATDQVMEGAATGTVVGVTALAGDGDATASVTYSLINDAGGRFAINAVTGVISVAHGTLLNASVSTAHVIDVQASSSDGSTSTMSLTIDVQARPLLPPPVIDPPIDPTNDPNEDPNPNPPPTMEPPPAKPPVGVQHVDEPEVTNARLIKSVGEHDAEPPPPLLPGIVGLQDQGGGRQGGSTSTAASDSRVDLRIRRAAFRVDGATFLMDKLGLDWRVAAMTILQQDWLGLPAGSRLETMFDEITRQDTQNKVLTVVTTAKIGGAIASAGVVAWVLRSGGLLTSLLVSTPAWRHLDPIPVLAPEEDKPDWGNDPDNEGDREERAALRLFRSELADGNREDRL